MLDQNGWGFSTADSAIVFIYHFIAKDGAVRRMEQCVEDYLLYTLGAPDALCCGVRVLVRVYSASMSLMHSWIYRYKSAASRGIAENLCC